ncbi:MAG: metal-sensitive transcriptional regulator [Bifidobacteriaceae bacterium]|jgi:DNA-binding FrmR family transcriptional regulator|nr:metal-sensitive transcriptional regulator [Bifidobacteriaceae bacterium]
MTETPADQSVAAQEPAAVRRQVLNRLNRAQGQLGAVIRAVEAGTDCRAVITQLAAVSAAVDRAGFAIVASGLKRCFSRDAGAGTSPDPAAAQAAGPPGLDADAGMTVQDYEKLFMMLA